MNPKLATICIASTLAMGVAFAQPAGPGTYEDASGLKGSGHCAEFSGWYTLTTRPIARGHAIAKFSYGLHGDRQCGAWAECEVITDSANQKAVRFRMQGHSENCVGGVETRDSTGQSDMVFNYIVR